MIILKRNMERERKPLTWRYLLHELGKSASIVCSNGHYGIITDHTIAEDGTVSPSIICQGYREGRIIVEECNFHEFIKLEGWEAE